MPSLNVFKKPLIIHSTRPLVGFMRNGYCDVPAEDIGNHSVAAVVSDKFLDFTASRGNDLRQIGLTSGCKWCLCASRWKEAFLAASEEGDEVVPRVFLNMTHEKALKDLELEDLKKYALDKRSEGAVSMR